MSVAPIPSWLRGSVATQVDAHPFERHTLGGDGDDLAPAIGGDCHRAGKPTPNDAELDAVAGGMARPGTGGIKAALLPVPGDAVTARRQMRPEFDLVGRTRTAQRQAQILIALRAIVGPAFERLRAPVIEPNAPRPGPGPVEGGKSTRGAERRREQKAARDHSKAEPTRVLLPSCQHRPVPHHWPRGPCRDGPLGAEVYCRPRRPSAATAPRFGANRLQLRTSAEGRRWALAGEEGTRQPQKLVEPVVVHPVPGPFD